MLKKLSLFLFLSVSSSCLYAMEKMSISALQTTLFRVYGYWGPMESLAEEAEKRVNARAGESNLLENDACMVENEQRDNPLKVDELNQPPAYQPCIFQTKRKRDGNLSFAHISRAYKTMHPVALPSIAFESGSEMQGSLSGSSHKKQKTLPYSSEDIKRDFESIFRDITTLSKRDYTPKFNEMIQRYGTYSDFVQLINETQDEKGRRLVHILSKHASLNLLKQIAELPGVNMHVLDKQNKDALGYVPANATRSETRKFLSNLFNAKRR